MKPPIKPMIEQLQAALDEEIALLETRRSQLEELSRVLVERDDDAAETLLEQMERTERLQASADLKLKSVREALADALGWQVGQLRLARLIGELPADEALALDRRRRRIIELAEEVRRQHLETALLLTECARITGMLLDRMLPAGEAVMTYGAEGSNLWRSGAGLLDTEL